MQPSFSRISGLVIVILFFSFRLTAQNNLLYSYQALSKFSLAKQKDSIKKNWVCPELFKDKSTQKKYKELWEERTSFIIGAIDANNFITEGDIYNYINQLIVDLTKGNSSLIKQRQLLLIDRSASVNAYAIGGNVIAVNLGLITFSKTREEIALVVAHELSHNILNHAENSMSEMAVWLTSEEYRNSVNAVLDSKYERLTKLKKVMQAYSFSRSKHHRYHESDADSLAIILLKNSHISFDPAVFLRLDSADNAYRQPLKNSTKNYFSSYNVPMEDWWFAKRSKGLSSKSYNFKDTTSLEDSLKTHPDCIERYKKTQSHATVKGTFTSVFTEIQEKANKMIIWNMYDNLDLTACLYRVLLEKDKGNADVWYDFMMHNIFAGLYYSDKKLNRFNAIGIKPKEYISKSYYELQNMLEQMPVDNLVQFYKSSYNQNFWLNMPAESKGLKTLMSAILFESEESDKKKSIAAKEFIDNNPTSMYCEFADHFKK
jgi:Zn-dependent protease with chaperone function